MRKIVSKIIRKNPHIYRLAQKVYRLFNREPATIPYHDDTLYIAFVLNDMTELTKIREKFETLNISKSEILLIVANDDINIHSLMPDYIALSLKYFKKYHRKFMPNNIFMPDSIEVIKEMF